MMQLSGRTPSEDLSLRPMGPGFGMKTMSPMRGGEIRRGASGPALHERSSLSGPPAPPPRPPPQQASIPEDGPTAGPKGAAGVPPPPARSAAGSAAASGAAPAAAAAEGGVPQLDKDALNKVRGIARALVEQSNKEEALDLLKALAEEAAPMGAVIKELLAAALDTRGVPVEERMERCKGFVAEQVNSSDGLVSPSDLASGIIAFIGNLPDLMEDVPKAPAFTARFVGDFVADGHVQLADIVKALLEAKSANGDLGDDEEGGAEQEEAALVDQNVAAPTVLQILAAVKEHKDEAAAKELWSSSGVTLQKLLPSYASDAAEQDKMLAKHNAQYLAA